MFVRLTSSEEHEKELVVVTKKKTPADVFMIDPSWTSKLVWDIYVMSEPKKGKAPALPEEM